MEAFHSFWSLPNSCRNNGVIEYPDFEIFTAILSALEWKKHNGRIRLITDTPGAKYFEDLGISSVWDEIDTSLDEIGSSVDPFLFWAAGKLYALKSVDMPCAMLDTDLIIWRDIHEVFERDIVCAHAEQINPVVYPDPHGFKFKNGYTLPAQWDYSQNASNTAFLFIKDNDFRDKYVAAALEIFDNLDMEGINIITGMCFAEQRVISMCAKEYGYTIDYLMDEHAMLDQEFVTHTWGFKDVLRRNPQANEEFCIRCATRIIKDFPEMEEMLRVCGKTKKYI